MARKTQAEVQLERAERKAKRDAARDEIMEARQRTMIGFAGAYVGEKILVTLVPALTPTDDADGSLAVGFGSIVDLGLAGGGAYFAFTDDGEMGDYATGAAMVGTTQLLDRISQSVITWIQKAQANAGT